MAYKICIICHVYLKLSAQASKGFNLGLIEVENFKTNVGERLYSRRVLDV